MKKLAEDVYSLIVAADYLNKSIPTYLESLKKVSQHLFNESDYRKQDLITDVEIALKMFHESYMKISPDAVLNPVAKMIRASEEVLKED